MTKTARTRRLVPGREFERRAMQILKEIQETLLPEHASEVLCINVETGKYTLGQTVRQAQQTFRRRWPGQISFQIRVDGGPVTKFHGK